jgi:WD40 repeat protein
MWIQKVPGGGVESLVIAPDGRTVYTADSSWWVTEWDTTARGSGKPLFRAQYGLRGLFFMGRGRFLVARSSVGDVYDTVAGAFYGKIGLNSTGSDSMRPLPGGDDTLLIERGGPETWNVIWRQFFSAPPGWITYGPTRDFDLAPDGRTGVQLHFTGKVFLIDRTRNGALTAQLELPYAAAQYVKVSPDGKIVVFESQKLGLWNPVSGEYRYAPEVVYSQRTRTPLLPTFAFHPSAPVFAALNTNGALTLFDLDSGKAIRSFDFALGKTVQCVTFSPDGLTCAVGGSNKQFAVFDVDL